MKSISKVKYTSEDFKNLTIDEMKKQFPYTDKKILKIAKDVSINRDVKIDDTIYNSSNSHIYSNFAQLQRILVITINDSGQDSVSPSGTYHSQRGITLQFHLRGFWDDKGKREFSINASKNTPSGMAIYGSSKIYDIQDIKFYINCIIDANNANNLTNMVY